MLVLTRTVSNNSRTPTPESRIVIDERIVIHILRSRGSSVRIGIDAPEGVSIRRGELLPQGIRLTDCGTTPHDPDTRDD